MGIKLTPQQFVSTYKPYAIACMKKTGLHYHATLTQAALESGWGSQAPGNNFFGIKDFDGVNGDEQLLTTTEVLKTDKAVFPAVLAIKKVGDLFYYTVKDWFKKYDSVEKCFTDHANFFLQNGRYSDAWHHRGDAELFLRLVAKAGYATAPDYEKQLVDTLKWFQRNS
jgi:flagellar protein FlgJ